MRNFMSTREVRDIRQVNVMNDIKALQADPSKGSNTVSRYLRGFSEEEIGFALPGRSRSNLDSSVGRKLRIRLLPHNPYFLRDVAEARAWLGLADDLFEIDDSARQYSELLRGQETLAADEKYAGFVMVATRSRIAPLADHAIEADLIRGFLRVYQRSVGPWSDQLPDRIVTAALAASTAFGRIDDRPSWLPYSVDGPVEASVDALLTRYRLPNSVHFQLRSFLLSGTITHIEHLEPDQVTVHRNGDPLDPDSFEIIVSGVDELMTRNTWNDIYDRLFLKLLTPKLNSRGMTRVPYSVVSESDYLDYLPVLNDLVGSGGGRSEAIARHPRLFVEQWTIDRRVKALLELLAPRELT
jgi:hypothetical protein